jgi:regulator of protease activity HflC (stomatin/prohibitin superfamily)
MNIAKGEAEAIRLKAEATALAIERIATVLKKEGIHGEQALQLGVAEKYIESFAEIAKEGNTVVVPSNIADVSSMVTQVLSVMKGINKQ